jgi:hypothetical protein
MPEENGKDLSMSMPQMVINPSQYFAPATYKNQPKPDVSDRWIRQPRLNKRFSWDCIISPGPSYSLSTEGCKPLWRHALLENGDRLEPPDIDSSLPERTDVGNLFNFSSSEQQLTIITTRKATAE